MSALQARLRLERGAFRLDASFEAERGITALFGASGSGKTTVLRCIAGLTRAQAGYVALQGECWQDEARGWFMPPHERACGYVFQEQNLFPHLSVRGNLAYGWKRMPAAERRAGFDHTVELLGLAPLLERMPANLSGGERQRVAMARAVLASPRLLLMDEPLASLDTARKGEILYYIERLRDDLQLPIVYVSHALDEVVRLADSVVVLSEGRVQASGAPAELTRRLELRPYLGRFEGGAVIETRVAEHDLEWGLTRLEFAGGSLYAPDVQALVGERVRVRVRARDVSLALSAPRDASFLNIVPGMVRKIEEGEGPSVDVELDLGGTALIARVTRRSVAGLRLEPGRRVFALIKSVAIDRHSVGYA
jgi:molybdate transport system ATP-binding protein